MALWVGGFFLSFQDQLLIQSREIQIKACNSRNELAKEVTKNITVKEIDDCSKSTSQTKTAIQTSIFFATQPITTGETHNLEQSTLIQTTVNNYVAALTKILKIAKITEEVLENLPADKSIELADFGNSLKYLNHAIDELTEISLVSNNKSLKNTQNTIDNVFEKYIKKSEKETLVGIQHFKKLDNDVKKLFNNDIKLLKKIDDLEKQIQELINKQSLSNQDSENQEEVIYSDETEKLYTKLEKFIRDESEKITTEKGIKYEVSSVKNGKYEAYHIKKLKTKNKAIKLNITGQGVDVPWKLTKINVNKLLELLDEIATATTDQVESAEEQ